MKLSIRCHLKGECKNELEFDCFCYDGPGDNQGYSICADQKIKDTVFVPIKKPIFQIVACRPWDP